MYCNCQNAANQRSVKIHMRESDSIIMYYVKDGKELGYGFYVIW